jgi:hypothetical protein
VTEESSVTDEAPVTDASAPEQPSAATEPVIQVLKGQPTDDEVAALVAVLAGASNGVTSADLEAHERDLWGHPVDRLRYSIFSWQKVTLVERLHLRR